MNEQLQALAVRVATEWFKDRALELADKRFNDWCEGEDERGRFCFRVPGEDDIFERVLREGWPDYVPEELCESKEFEQAVWSAIPEQVWADIRDTLSDDCGDANYFSRVGPHGYNGVSQRDFM